MCCVSDFHTADSAAIHIVCMNTGERASGFRMPFVLYIESFKLHLLWKRLSGSIASAGLILLQCFVEFENSRYRIYFGEQYQPALELSRCYKVDDNADDFVHKKDCCANLALL